MPRRSKPKPVEPELPAGQEWRFLVGANVGIRDPQYYLHQYRGLIVGRGLVGDQQRYLIHYYGWNKSRDEWRMVEDVIAWDDYEQYGAELAASAEETQEVKARQSISKSPDKSVGQQRHGAAVTAEDCDYDSDLVKKVVTKEMRTLNAVQYFCLTEAPGDKKFIIPEVTFVPKAPELTIKGMLERIVEELGELRSTKKDDLERARDACQTLMEMFDQSVFQCLLFDGIEERVYKDAILTEVLPTWTEFGVPKDPRNVDPIKNDPSLMTRYGWPLVRDTPSDCFGSEHFLRFMVMLPKLCFEIEMPQKYYKQMMKSLGKHVMPLFWKLRKTFNVDRWEGDLKRYCHVWFYWGYYLHTGNIFEGTPLDPQQYPNPLRTTTTRKTKTKRKSRPSKAKGSRRKASGGRKKSEKKGKK